MTTTRTRPYIVVLASSSSQVAHYISNALRDYDIDTFYAPEDIVLGDNWWDRISNEIKRADGAVIVLDPYSNRRQLGWNKHSDEPWLRREIKALNLHKAENPAFRIIPVIHEPQKIEEIPQELLTYEALLIDSEPTAQHIDSIIQSLPHPSRGLETEQEEVGLEQLAAEAEILSRRLKLLAAPSSFVLAVFIISLITFASGISIIAYTITATQAFTQSVFQHWEFIGPLLTVSGGLSAYISGARWNWERKRAKWAYLLLETSRPLLDEAEELLGEGPQKVELGGRLSHVNSN